MRSPAQVGIVGCGVISRTYAGNESAFDAFDILNVAPPALRLPRDPHWLPALVGRLRGRA